MKVFYPEITMWYEGCNVPTVVSERFEADQEAFDWIHEVRKEVQSDPRLVSFDYKIYYE